MHNESALTDALFASFSMPGYFPPAKVFDSLYFDGSAVYEIDIITGIEACIDKGFANSNIIVDIILTSEAHLTTVNATNYKSIGMYFRYLEITHFYSQMDGVARARFAFPDVNWRHAVSPSKKLPSSSAPFVRYL